MKIKFSAIAKKQFKKLPKNETEKVLKKLRVLENNPHAGKKLKGKLKGDYSLRAWPYRIIYLIQSSTVIVETIEHRQGVYK